MLVPTEQEMNLVQFRIQLSCLSLVNHVVSLFSITFIHFHMFGLLGFTLTCRQLNPIARLAISN
jgi:hypothetical protein